MNLPRFLLVVLALSASSAFAGIADHVVRTRIAGVDVIAYPTAVKDVVTIYGSLPAGDAFAGEQHPDVATLTGMMLDKGTTTADKFAIAQQLESVGATISFSVGAQTLGVRAKCLRKDTPAILRLIVEQLRRPAFPAAEFEKAKKQLAGALQRSLEDTDSRAAEAFARAVYPAGHPNRPASTREMLAALGHTELADVRAFYARYYGPAHFTLVIVGDLDVPKIQSELRKDLSGWRGGVDAVRQARAETGGGAREEKIPMADKTSVSIVLGQASGLRYADADSIPLRVGAAVLGSGFTGRLMQIVRDREGLTYGIGAYLDNDTFTDGDWRISGSFAPQLLDKGIASTRRELERWWRDGITAEELAARKTDLVGSYKVSLATTDGMASVMLRFIQRGKPLSWLDDYPKAIEAVTLAEVNGAIRKHLDPDKMTLVEAGTLPAAN